MAFRAFLGDSAWPLWVANTIAQDLILIPSVLILAYITFTHQYKLLKWLVIPTAAFLYFYTGLFLPNCPASIPAGSQPLRVMTYNVLNRNTDYSATANLILSQSPDLVGLEEMLDDNAERINKLLTDEYPFHTPLPTKHELDVVLFSRYPIISSEKLNVPWHDLSVHAVVDVDGQPVNVIVLHLIPSLPGEVPLAKAPQRITERSQIRAQQIDIVLRLLKTLDAPVLVMCDCNFTQETESYGKLDRLLNDTFAEVGWGFGNTIHPLGFRPPLQKIDYVWHSGGFAPYSAKVVQGGLSDHYPLVVDLYLLPKR